MKVTFTTQSDIELIAQALYYYLDVPGASDKKRAKAIMEKLIRMVDDAELGGPDF